MLVVYLWRIDSVVFNGSDSVLLKMFETQDLTTQWDANLPWEILRYEWGKWDLFSAEQDKMLGTVLKWSLRKRRFMYLTHLTNRNLIKQEWCSFTLAAWPPSR